MLPSPIARTFKVPFARAKRVDDYWVAWAFFDETNHEICLWRILHKRKQL